MTTATAQFTREEIVQRGKEIYERDIRSLIEAGNKGRVVAIDVLTGNMNWRTPPQAASANCVRDYKRRWSSSCA